MADSRQTFIFHQVMHQKLTAYLLMRWYFKQVANNQVIIYGFCRRCSYSPKGLLSISQKYGRLLCKCVHSFKNVCNNSPKKKSSNRKTWTKDDAPLRIQLLSANSGCVMSAACVDIMIPRSPVPFFSFIQKHPGESNEMVDKSGRDSYRCPQGKWVIVVQHSTGAQLKTPVNKK